MNPGIVMEKSGYRLRAICQADADMLLRWRNADHVRTSMYTDHVIGEEEHRHWVSRMISFSQPRVLIFEQECIPLGVTSLTQIYAEHQRVHWGFYMSDAAIGKGVAFHMLYLALNYLFDERKMRKVCGEVLAFNERSITLHERLGFIREGTLKAHCLKNGRPEDVISLALFKPGWETHRQTLDIFS